MMLIKIQLLYKYQEFKLSVIWTSLFGCFRVILWDGTMN